MIAEASGAPELPPASVTARARTSAISSVGQSNAATTANLCWAGLILGSSNGFHSGGFGMN